MNTQWKSLWACLPSLLLLSCVSLAGPEKKTQGQVADAGALLKVHTFCLNTNTLTTQQEDSLKKVLARAGKPKGVLTKLNWKLLDSCDSSDATVTVKMEEHEESVPTGDNGSVGGPPEAR
jgi:hypothetical protein